VLVGADLFRAVLVLSLLWPQGAWHAYLVAAGLAAGNAFFNPTVQAVIPDLTTPDQRLAANSVAWSTGRLVQIVAAALAGGLIGTIGPGPAFALNAASFVASGLLIATLAIPPHAGQIGDGGRSGYTRYLADLREGLHFALRNRFVSRLLLVQALASLATGATGALLVVLAEQHLQVSPSGFAWLIGAIGVGALLGPLIPNVLARNYRDARWLSVPYIIRGVGDALLGIVTSLPVVLLLLFVYGLSTSAGIAVYSSIIQAAVPDAVRGRVFTLLDVTWNGMRLLSLGLGGILVDLLGVQAVFWLGGLLLALAGSLGLALLPTAPPRSTSSEGYS